jgi:hypothetical protein
MPRKSAAALEITPPNRKDGRVAAPAGLTKVEREMWADVVQSKPADWFDADSVPVLKEYIRAALTCDQLARLVAQAMEGDPEDLKLALDMRDKEAKRCANLATKLRLTQQSRYTPQSASTANRKASGARPWAA